LKSIVDIDHARYLKEGRDTERERYREREREREESERDHKQGVN
jgi:hypothetical protein